jgi:hypothetical protein
MDQKPNFYMPSKEDFASVCFYKLEYLSCLDVMLPNLLKVCSSSLYTLF